MIPLLALEYRKLWGQRSVRLALLAMLLLPFIWLLAALLNRSASGGGAFVVPVYNLALVSGWQMPSLTLITTAQFLLPLFIAVSCAELIGAEAMHGTLAPLVLRPLNRVTVLVAKLIVALSYPALLLLVLLAASLLSGAGFGFGDFSGGSGLGAGGFVGQGPITGGAAALEVARGFALAAVTLMPIAALALLFGVVYLNTAAAALATIATLLVMRLLTVFPEAVQKLLLTTHLDAYLRLSPADVVNSLTLLIIYTVGFGVLAVFTFERKDV